MSRIVYTVADTVLYPATAICQDVGSIATQTDRRVGAVVAAREGCVAGDAGVVSGVVLGAAAGALGEGGALYAVGVDDAAVEVGRKADERYIHSRDLAVERALVDIWGLVIDVE